MDVMRVLITGAEGQLGRALQDRLQRSTRHYEVLGMRQARTGCDV